MASTEPKTETEVPSTNAPKTETEVPATIETKVLPTDVPNSEKEVPVPNAPLTETEVPSTNAPKTETDVPPTGTPKAMVSEIKTVEVSSITMGVTEKDIWEFFSFSGNIHYIEMKSESETTQHAFVTFKESQGANTAVLLTGATIGQLPVSVRHIQNYQLPPEAPPLTQTGSPTSADRKAEVAQKAEEVVSTMLAKGFVLGKDALKKAKSFDEKHQLTSNASATVASIDRKMGLTQKLSMGTAVMNEKMKEVNDRYQVTEATKSAIAKAEQKANSAGSALMSNPYLSSGAVWVSGAFAAFAKAADSVGSKTKEKVGKAEEGKEGSKIKENVHEAERENESKSKENVREDEKKKESKTNEKVEGEEDKDGSKTIESVQAEAEKDKLTTKEYVQKAEEEIDGSKTKDNVHIDESSNKDSTVTPVKPSTINNLPIQ